MFERIFTPALVFMLLAGGTCAIGSELFASGPAAAARTQSAVVELPRVMVIGRRLSAPVAVAETETAQTARASLQ